MKVEGWSSSMVATKYMHQEIKAVRDLLTDELGRLGVFDDLAAEERLGGLLKMLSYNYKADTGVDLNEDQ
jgi:hypothetical protein